MGQQQSTFQTYKINLIPDLPPHWKKSQPAPPLQPTQQIETLEDLLREARYALFTDPKNANTPKMLMWIIIHPDLSLRDPRLSIHVYGLDKGEDNRRRWGQSMDGKELVFYSGVEWEKVGGRCVARKGGY